MSDDQITESQRADLNEVYSILRGAAQRARLTLPRQAAEPEAEQADDSD